MTTASNCLFVWQSYVYFRLDKSWYVTQNAFAFAVIGTDYFNSGARLSLELKTLKSRS
jgi:hypothetical protein